MLPRSIKNSAVPHKHKCLDACRIAGQRSQRIRCLRPHGRSSVHSSVVFSVIDIPFCFSRNGSVIATFAVLTNDTVKAGQVQAIAQDFRDYLDTSGTELQGFKVVKENSTIQSIYGRAGRAIR